MPKTLHQQTMTKRIMHAKAVGYMKPDIDPQLRLYVPFNEGVGSVAKDYSQYANHAQLTDVEWSPDGINGNAGKFNGTTSHGDNGHDVNLDITSEITIETWVNFPKLPSAQSTDFPTLLGKSAGTYVLELNKGAGTIRFPLRDSNNNNHYMSFDESEITTGRFYHLIGTYDGTTQRFYLDAAEKGNLTWSDTIRSTPTNNVNIGRAYWGGYHFEGTIAEARIYNRAQSAAQIAADCYEVVCN